MLALQMTNMKSFNVTIKLQKDSAFLGVIIPYRLLYSFTLARVTLCSNFTIYITLLRECIFMDNSHVHQGNP